MEAKSCLNQQKQMDKVLKLSIWLEGQDEETEGVWTNCIVPSGSKQYKKFIFKSVLKFVTLIQTAIFC